MSRKGVASARFLTTDWSQVRRAGDLDQAVCRPSLDELLQRYLPPLRLYLVRTRRFTGEQADDLLQGFVLDRVLRGELLARADPKRGRFRNLLLTSLNRYISKVCRRQDAHDVARVRVSDHPELSAADDNPADVFDAAWAQQVVSESLQRMQADCLAAAREDVWVVFNVRIVHPVFNNTPPPSYGDIVRQFGYDSPTQAYNILATGKRMFERVLRAVIGEYADDSQAISEEIDDLRKALARQAA